MRIETLQYFITAADCKSMTLASNILHISQQSISKEIKLLEDELGTTLFSRSKHGVALTQDGVIAYDQARAILQSVNRLNHSFKREPVESNNRSTLNLAAFTAFKCHLEIILKLARERFSNLQVSEYYHSSTLIINEILDKRSCDIILLQIEKNDFMNLSFSTDEYSSIVLLEEPILIGTNSSTFFTSPLPIQALSDYDIHFFSYSPDEISIYQKISQEYNIPFKHSYKSSIKNFKPIIDGSSVFFITKATADFELDNLPLKFYPLDIDASMLTVLFIKSKLLANEEIQYFLDIFKNFFLKYT